MVIQATILEWQSYPIHPGVIIIVVTVLVHEPQRVVNEIHLVLWVELAEGLVVLAEMHHLTRIAVVNGMVATDNPPIAQEVIHAYLFQGVDLAFWFALVRDWWKLYATVLSHTAHHRIELV